MVFFYFLHFGRPGLLKRITDTGERVCHRMQQWEPQNTTYRRKPSVYSH